jgi:isochorismate synthase
VTAAPALLESLDGVAARRGARALVAARLGPIAPRLLERALTLDEDATLWAPPEGPALLGLGVAAVVEARGPARFAGAASAASGLLDSLPPVTVDETLADAGAAELATMAPVLLGGFAFVPGAVDERGPFRAFPDARFVLPRVTLRIGRDGAATVLAVVDEAAERTQALVADLVALAARAPEGEREVEPPGARFTDQLSELAWAAMVDEARREILDGRLEKVVLARRARIEAERPFDATRILVRLAEAQSGCTRFAFRRRGTVFLGATPELLVRRSGARVTTEALAGSVDARRGDRVDALLGSAKDRGEHALVVREIVRALARFCDEVRAAESPSVRPLRHVAHLRTPIEGTLARPAHLFALAEALHPTPAVGGVPSEEALAFIAAHEPVARGWYAGPVGWVDARGDGELAVALRSGVVDGRVAEIWAGAGIVRASDPTAEYAETALKQAALATALEVER